LKYRPALGRIRAGGKLMEKDRLLYPISEEVFNQKFLPVIGRAFIRKGCQPKSPHYKAFFALMYILKTGRTLRDLPETYGYWHMI
jgi:hypothetical protein